MALALLSLSYDSEAYSGNALLQFLCWLIDSIFDFGFCCRFLNMAESKPGLRKPVFTKVDQLRPGTSGHTLTVKVVSTKMVAQRGRADSSRQARMAECLVGDETGMIIFTARNDQGIFVIALVLLSCIYRILP